MTLNIWFAYISITCFFSATPGPVMMLALAHGNLYGIRKTIFGILGTSAGNLLLMLLSVTALSAVLKASPRILYSIKLAGAFYLIYLGVRIFNLPNTSASDAQRISNSNSSIKNIFIRSFIVAASNPKGIIFFSALFPQFISANNSLTVQFSLLAGSFLIIDAAWQLLYAGGGSTLKNALKKYNGSNNIINQISGSMIALSGAIIIYLHIIQL